jgi:SynChlorMet cassette radical SAM/SPASM protein ScmE
LKTPRHINIAITGRCNLRCKYCFYNNEMTELNDLPTEQWIALFNKLGFLGVMDITFTGGEAFIRPDLFTLIDSAIANHMRYTILSNGTLIDEMMLAKFSVGKRRQRLNAIQISIDGSQAEVHDKSRPNSFVRAIHGLRLLKETGFPVTVRVTINRNNVHDLENIAHLLLDEIDIPSFTTNEAMAVGSGCQNEHEVSLTSVEMQQAMKTLAKLQIRYPDRIRGQAGPIAKRVMYREMEEAKQSGKNALSWCMGYLTACGCVFSSLDILHDGTIVPCHMLSGLPIGNVATDSIGELWTTHPTLIALRERRSIPMHLVVGCEDCEWTQFCNGSCPGLAYQFTGDFNRSNSKDCYRNFLIETGKQNAL